MMGLITVIGSLNMDLVVRTGRIPKAGETLPGAEFQMIPGGKGANQALASRRFGAETSIFGCVGQDAFGAILLDSLRDNGVSTKNVLLSEETSTGTATILVDDHGENRIVVVAGANALVSREYIQSCWEEISHSSIILLQHEIPLDTISMVVERAAAEKIPVFLNPAPFYPISDALLRKLDGLILNEREGTELSCVPISDKATAMRAAENLLQKGVGTVIVTLGKQGAVLVDKDGPLFQPAFNVKALDTTAAGDTFVGVFAASVLDGKSKREALFSATAAAGLTVTRKGAQPSIPSYDEVMAFISENPLNHRSSD